MVESADEMLLKVVYGEYAMKKIKCFEWLRWLKKWHNERAQNTKNKCKSLFRNAKRLMSICLEERKKKGFFSLMTMLLQMKLILHLQEFTRLCLRRK